MGYCFIIDFFWPVGLYLMWKYAKWPKVAKIIVTILVALCFISYLGQMTGKKSSAVTAPSVSAQPANNAAESVPAAVSSASSSPAVATSAAELTYEREDVYTNSLDGIIVDYVATIKNTGSDTISLDSVSLDVEKADGTILTSDSMVNVLPRILAAGETAYVYSEPYNSTLGTSNSISKDEIGKTILHYTVNKHGNVDALPVEITELQISTQYGIVKVVGRIENKGTQELDTPYIVTPIMSADGKLLCVPFTISDNIAAGDKKGFEATVLGIDPSLDLSGATVSGFAFDGFVF